MNDSSSPVPEGDRFLRYTPQHPLPEELKKLARDDTVCKYCGVSYLIHNEIKALEDKLKEVEKELSLLRGQKDREELLKKENASLDFQKQELQLTLESNSALIQSLNDEIEKLKVEEKLKQESSNRYKTKYMDTLRQLSKLSQVVRQQKETLSQIKHQMMQWKQEMCSALASAVRNMTSLKQASTKEKTEFESLVQCIEMEKVVLSQSNKNLAEQLKSKDEELRQTLERLQLAILAKDKLQQDKLDSVGVLKELEEAKKSLQVLATTEKKLNVSVLQCNELSSEVEQFKIQLRRKGSEVTDLINQLKQVKQDQEVGLQKIKLELQSKEEELSTCLRSLKNLENELRDREQKEHKISQERNSSLNEVQDLKESLERARGDREALKAEREMMIQAHQNRIEDLRDSFKKKMAQMDDWPQKLQAAVTAEKNRCLSEMKALEDNLKHNFVLELQIEKDKYNELLKKFQAQEKDKESVRDNKVIQLEQQYKQEIEALKRQVTEVKKKSSEREEELNTEIANLKNIINNLQDRFAKLDGEDSHKVSKLQADASLLQHQLSQNQDQMASLEDKLKQAKEKNNFLQGIVQKECEERFELTEALSDARKELLSLKMPAGGFNNQKRGSISSLQSVNTPPSVNSNNHEDALLKSRSQMPTNNVKISYNNNNNNTSNNTSRSSTGKSKETQIMESRKRIANMLGRYT